MALTIDRVTTNVSTNADGEVVGDGVFDTLMETVTKHVNAQFESNHITGEEYANVYLGLVQTAMAQSMDFVKNQDLLDAQLIKANAEAEAAETAADNMHVKTLAEVDKIYGFSYTLDANGDIDRSSLVDTADGKLDYENLNIVEQTALTAENISLTTEKIESENKNNMVDGVLDAQIAKVKADADIAYQKSLVEKANAEATTVKVLGYSYEFDANGDFIGVDTGAGKLDYETNLMAEQLDSERIGQKAKIAQVRDEFGREIDETNDSISSEVGLKHTQTLAILEEDALRKNEETTIAKAKVFEADTDHWLKKFKALREEGVSFNTVTNESLGELKTASNDTGNITFTTSIDTTGVPTSKWESDMRRSDKEIAVADASEKGYKADSYYKQYKSLQELMFSLTNSQIVERDDTQDGSVYARLVEGIELNMNKQSLVWEGVPTTATKLVNLHAGNDLALTQAVLTETE